jgi:multidrug efflux pump subunit AcrB
VARVQIEGAPKPEVRIELDPERMRATGIGVEPIAAALRAANAASPGGVLRRRGIRYALHFESELRTARDIENVRVGGTPSQPILLRDVARVEQGPAERGSRNGAPAVGLLILPVGANPRTRRSAAPEVRKEFPAFRSRRQDASRSCSDRSQTCGSGWLGGPGVRRPPHS